MTKLAIALGLTGALFMGCNNGGGTDTMDTEDGPFIPTTLNTDATCSIPTGPWGQSPGHQLQGWTISDCDGNPYTLHNNDFCTAEITVLIQSEGWCGVCQQDAVDVYEALIGPYSERGVRFMEVLSVDDHYAPIASEFCHTWASRYGIEGFTFMDPERKLSTYSYRPGIDEEPSGSNTLALPIVKILDNTGTLVEMFQGGDTAWSRTVAKLDEMLAASGQ